MILGLFPELLGTGGIQRISRHAAAVLSSFARGHGLTCLILSLNDPPGRHDIQVGDVGLAIRAFGRQKGRYVLSVVAAAPRTRSVYIGHPHLAPLGLILTLLRPGIRYWVAVYGIDAWERLPLLRRAGLRLAHGVTALSQYTARKTVDTQGVDSERVVVLPPALDPEFLGLNRAPDPAELRSPMGKMVLSVARLSASDREKGVDTVIRALPRVLRLFPDTSYLVVGNGNDRHRLERLANDTGVSDHVLVRGEVGEAELSRYYAMCDIFVMPSRKEGFGLVFLEAMAFAKPVIGGNHGGTPEVIVDGETGFLVRHGDAAALADHVIHLLGDEGLRRRMGEAGRRWVEENFAFEQFQQRLVQALTDTNVR